MNAKLFSEAITEVDNKYYEEAATYDYRVDNEVDTYSRAFALRRKLKTVLIAAVIMALAFSTVAAAAYLYHVFIANRHTELPSYEVGAKVEPKTISAYALEELKVKPYQTYKATYGEAEKYLDVDLLIHIGEVSGAYDAFTFQPKQVWRVGSDGEIRDQFKRLTAVFEMSEMNFFSNYLKGEVKDDSFLEVWKEEIATINSKIPELPFSNIWIAQQVASRLPENSLLYLGILNSLRSWNYFETPATVEEHSNTGGFGIDGIMSTLIGSSFGHLERIHFAVVGDLSFFYDMNSLGNRHIGNNVRILVVNNGKGMEFRMINHNGGMFGDEADKYIAAAGHFGNQSPQVLRHLVSDWGYEYMMASNKEEFNTVIDRFLYPEITDRPMVLEVFTDTVGETTALKMMGELVTGSGILLKNKAKEAVVSVVGEKGKRFFKSILKR